MSEVEEVWEALRESEGEIKKLTKYQNAWLALKHNAKRACNDWLYSEMDRLEANFGI